MILITNDDGVESPALLPLAHALAELGPIGVVVPEAERSWIGKAISRWEDVRTRFEVREGVEITLVSGSPADCANLGVHNLFDEPLEMLVSGVNIGLNTGAGFFLSSGTVGAAMEGWIAGLPALAFSIGVAEDDRSWKQGAKLPESKEIWERAATIVADVVGTVRQVGFPEGVDLLNVNFRIDADSRTPRVVTELARVGYAQLFARKGEHVYAHDYAGRPPDPNDAHGTDVAVVHGGLVSITPVRLVQKADLSPAVRAALERGDP